MIVPIAELSITIGHLPTLQVTMGPVVEQPEFRDVFAEVNMAAGQLKTTQQATLVVQKLDRKGNPTTDDFDAPPAWGSSDHAVATVETDAAGVATVKAGAPGVCQISFDAANEGVQFAGTFDLTVVPGDVASVTISIGTVEEQP